MKRLPGCVVALTLCINAVLLCGCNKATVASEASTAAAGSAGSTASGGTAIPPKLLATPASPALAHDIAAYKARQGIK